MLLRFEVVSLSYLVHFLAIHFTHARMIFHTIFGKPAEKLVLIQAKPTSHNLRLLVAVRYVLRLADKMIFLNK